MTLAERIIEFRAHNNLTQTEFANMVGVSMLTVWRAENGENINKITKSKIEQVIGKVEG